MSASRLLQEPSHRETTFQQNPSHLCTAATQITTRPHPRQSDRIPIEQPSRPLSPTNTIPPHGSILFVTRHHLEAETMTSVLTGARLLTLPLLAYIAYRDVRTRRIPRRIWPPLLGVALIVLAADIYTTPTPAAQTRLILISLIGLALALILAAPMVLSNSFGTADAFAFVTLALLFPTIPHIEIGGLSLPAAPSPPLFFLAILSNTVLATLAYPLHLLLRNLRRGTRSSRLLTGSEYAWANVLDQHGTLFTPTDELIATGVDLDALRAYLEWRDASLVEIRDDRTRFRHPETIPSTSDDAVDNDSPTTRPLNTPPSENDLHVDGGTDVTGATASDRDPWGAAAFINRTDADLYGATPRQLRTALDQLADATTDTVWVSPGIPLLLPLFTGLVLAILASDLWVNVLTSLQL